MKRIVILTASIGGGHNATSNAIKTYADTYRDEYEVVIIDVIEYIIPTLSKVVEKTYELNVKNFPEFYGWQYDMNNNIDGKLASSLLPFHSKLKDLITEYEPDVIICVHPVSVSSIIRVREKYGFNYKVVVVVTDYDYHASWIHENVDMFIVSSNFMRLKLIDDKIPEDRIKDTGIPTNHELNNRVDKYKARYMLNLKDKNTILIMGGSFGAGNLMDLVNAVMESSLDLQCVVIAGNNKKLKKELLKIFGETDKDIIIEGYTEKISLYMDAADVLVTKPGGLTVTEALIKNLPLIITKPIPGQEEENATYLLNHGIGVRLDKEKELHILIEDLLTDQVRLKHMIELQNHYAKPDAVKDLFLAIDDLMRV